MSNNADNIKSLAVELMNKAMSDVDTFTLLREKFESVQGLRPWKNAVYFRQPMSLKGIVSYARKMTSEELVVAGLGSLSSTYVVARRGTTNIVELKLLPFVS